MMARPTVSGAKPVPAGTIKRMSGARALIECLHRVGVGVIFGHPGGAALPLYDALYDAREIRHVLVRHEQVAAHAAVGYHRVTGKIGVCMATSGPGATNLRTGTTTAMMDWPGIAPTTGRVRTLSIGPEAFPGPAGMA